MATASQITRREGKERIKTIRKNVTTSDGSHTFLVDQEFIVLRNGGVNEIRVNFKTEDLDVNYMLILPGDVLPPIGIYKDLVMNYKSVGGPSKLEGILWA